ncbi:MAG TPA: hypothetical protein VFG87_21595 [Amycolatopsis sp.]|nr:hypothetical protein [Amycolatopsis sp.]
MKIAPRTFWNRLRPYLRGRKVILFRRALAVSLLVLAASLAARPTGPAPPGEPPAAAPRADAVPVGPGFSTVPIRLADAGVAELLRRGMRVDVVTIEAGDQTRRVLASMATVIDVRSPPPPGGHLLSTADKGPLVLISVPVELATQVAASSLRSPVAVTLR